MINDPLSTIEAAAFLSVHPVTLARWRMRGAGPKYYRNGYRSYWYSREDLRKYLASTSTHE
jgi:hypothetical protein